MLRTYPRLRKGEKRLFLTLHKIMKILNLFLDYNITYQRRS